MRNIVAIQQQRTMYTKLINRFEKLSFRWFCEFGKDDVDELLQNAVDDMFVEARVL